MIEEKVREAIIVELERQAEISQGDLRVERSDDKSTAHGPVDVDALAMAVAGALSGGP